MDYNSIAPQLKRLSEKAIDIALEIVRTEGAKLHPFVIYGNDSDKLERFIVDSNDEALEAAIEFIEEIEDGSEAVVYVFKDLIQLNDGKFDAIIVQIYGTDEDNGYSFGQLYRVADNKIQLLNEKVFLGEIRNILVF